MADPLKPPARGPEGRPAPPEDVPPSAGREPGGPAPEPAGDAVPPVSAPVADVRSLDMDAVRRMRREAQREESDLSYLRRLLQGRIDILRAELARRADPASAAPFGGPAPVMAKLSEILSEPPAPARGARHVTVHPPRTSRYRTTIERMLADVELSDLPALGDAALRRALEGLTGYEHEVSALRQELQREADRCGAEIARRYREGEARVDDLLSGR
ncbi:ABC transporter substrate-binding protein [Yinghuangia seranimata]|uniref:RsiG family protein n=1 Tax=Yinghuangia seranimata TaxID=408067 RepID=UPI00248CEE15|nr:ABC transporter substrate-binding protein [Yinghuangia seranimata]MDI2131763.1 ABC transporter substrate-binding protein [Yinghuangia seranimata]